MNGITKKPPSSSQKSPRRGLSESPGGSAGPRTNNFAESSYEGTRSRKSPRVGVALRAEGLPTGLGLAAASTSTSHNEATCLWLQQFLPLYEHHADAAVEKFLLGDSIHIPDLPKNKDCQSLVGTMSKRDRVKKHYGLLTGEPATISGTYEIADWISHTLHLTSSQSGSENRDTRTSADKSFWGKIEVPKVIENEVVYSFHGVYDDLKFLHKIRTMVSFYRNGYYSGVRDPSMWAGYQTVCAVAVLEHLQRNGRALIPMDFMITDKAHVAASAAGEQVPITDAHATCAVIEKVSGVDAYKVHHFESNGTLGKKMTKEEMRKKRTIGDSEVQRHWTFTPDMVSPAPDTIAAKFSGKLRIFARTSFTGTLSVNKIQISIKELSDDISLIAELLFPENFTHIQDMNPMLRHQRRVLEMFGSKEVERQRIHTEQENPSCELKSLTMALGYLMNDEAAYQALIGSLIQEAKADCAKNIRSQALKASMANQLDVEFEEVKARFHSALSPLPQAD